MKKVLFVAAFAAIGLASAFASTHRATVQYGQNPDGSYKLLTQPFDPAKCTTPVVNPCGYTSPANIGSPVTKAQLLTAGAVPATSFNRIYTGI